MELSKELLGIVTFARKKMTKSNMFFQEIEEVEEHIIHSKQDYDELQL